MPNISDYDKFDYDYTKYWKDKSVDRVYEDKAERIALKKLLPKKGRSRPNQSGTESNGWFVDLGGSFGRLFDTYKDSFEGKIIVDYSLDSLKLAAKTYHLSPKTYFVAANAYHLPFKDESIDALMTIRLLHHIEDVPGMFKELDRVISKNLILEYANKRHGLAVLRRILRRGKINPFSRIPEGQGDLFYNFHPKYIAQNLRENGFGVKKALSVSNFRHRIFKKILPASLLYFKESIAQHLLAPITFGPSMFILAEKRGDLSIGYARDGRGSAQKNLNAILACPKCQSDDLDFSKDKVKCKKCSTNYPIIDYVYDFRV